jgi:hypothetical protein
VPVGSQGVGDREADAFFNSRLCQPRFQPRNGGHHHRAMAHHQQGPQDSFSVGWTPQAQIIKPSRRQPPPSAADATSQQQLHGENLKALPSS